MTDAPVRIRPEIAALPPYKQGTQAGPGAFKLSSNENPFDPLPGVLDAVRDAASFNRYPDAAATRLRERLAARFDVTTESVHVGAGSVSILAQLILAAAGPGDEVLYAWRSFEAYPGLVLIAGATPVQVPLLPDATHDLVAMAAAVTERTRVVIVCSPNNPTGTIVTQAAFDEFVAAVPSDVLVILDEAYIEFVTDPDAVDGRRVLAAGAHPNVVVLRTFSKAFGLAGLRVGYAIGHPRILDAARTTAIPLAVTAQAETAAIASLDAEAALLERVGVIAARARRARRRAARARLGGAASPGQLRLAAHRGRDAHDRRAVRRRRPRGPPLRRRRHPNLRRRAGVCGEDPRDRGIRCPDPPRKPSSARDSVER